MFLPIIFLLIVKLCSASSISFLLERFFEWAEDFLFNYTSSVAVGQNMMSQMGGIFI